MAKFFIAAGVIIIAVLVYWIVVFFYKYSISKQLVRDTVAYQKLNSDHAVTLLVLGDSSGVGVGAKNPDNSVAARLAVAMGATYVENRAVSGAVVADVAGQMKRASLPRYTAVLVQIGGNDIVAFHNAQKTAAMLAPSIQKAVSISNMTILMSAGNLGAVTNFPPPMRPYYTNLTLQYHTAFTAMAQKAGAVYVNLYTLPEQDPFTKDPGKYLAADGFHPSDDGYGLWFERLEETLHPKQ